MLEIEIEQYLRERVEARGGLCEKFTSPGRRGVPDRLITWPDGLMQLVETKAPCKNVNSPQRRDHRERARRRVRVFVIRTKEQVDEYVHVQCPDLRPLE